ncbi:hypothetical protein N7493_011201 [Penicillium malachiteum]|uniref:Uncharacterized protein n=1 Tax=Penicillium malachiteum TaxID=1324776 RepID=A0AAD6MR15_9EURO|nr:hypothetical protein N7493_011201 [Penicillium malachiteum]
MESAWSFTESDDSDIVQFISRKRRKLSRTPEWEVDEGTMDVDEEGESGSFVSEVTHNSPTPQTQTHITCGDGLFSCSDSLALGDDLFDTQAESSNSRSARPNQNVTDEAAFTSETLSPSSSEAPHTETDQVICFGMDGDIFDVLYSPSNTLLLKKQDKTAIGRVANPDVLRLFAGLHDDPGIKLQLYILGKVGPVAPRRRSKQAVLNVIVYGSMELFEDVGDFFQSNGFYLQKPRGCDRNVRYHNPHCISGLDSDTPWTFDLDLVPELYGHFITPYDVLAGLETDESLPEAEDYKEIKTPLYKHQRQALSFMRRRENGWLLHTPMSDVWSEHKLASGKVEYVNNITNDRQRIAPPMFRGGILADDMGLGKTLTMIALIASDRSKRPNGRFNHGRLLPQNCKPTNATLIVVPSSLLQQWQTQLQDHVNREVCWTIHHGQNKLHSRNQIDQYKIILTSYQTLASEYRTQKSNPRGHTTAAQSIILTSFWHRIVLDEAHSIRNPRAIRTGAVLSLEGSSRWAITGTPIQNSLSDFASLVEFLRAHPYCKPKVFKADIVDVWKQENEKVALERVTRLFKFISIRRTKNILNLPEKKDLVYTLQFSDFEMRTYRSLESPIMQMIERELESGEPDSKQYGDALVRINKLRQFCNMGLSAQKPNIGHDMKQLSDLGAWSSGNARIIFEDLLSSGQIECSICDTDIQWTANSDCSFGDCVSLSPKEESDENYATNLGFSTKVLSLKRELQRHTAEKCVVFSSWTSTLDVIACMLDKSAVKYVRIDGRVSIKNRARALKAYQHDRSIQVMLLSIACGAEGLNLTAASRVYLMEPQWNPNLEAQALARVYRLGQTKPVTTTRFIIKDSIESHVINVQDQKKHLGDLLLSQQKGSSANTRIRFQHLRRLLR